MPVGCSIESLHATPVVRKWLRTAKRPRCSPTVTLRSSRKKLSGRRAKLFRPIASAVAKLSRALSSQRRLSPRQKKSSWTRRRWTSSQPKAFWLPRKKQKMFPRKWSRSQNWLTPFLRSLPKILLQRNRQSKIRLQMTRLRMRVRSLKLRSSTPRLLIRPL